MVTAIENKKTQTGFDKQTVLKDFYDCCLSRELSFSGRKEVLTGKAKFGIMGAGKEVPLVAIAHAFQKGDFWSGYYRDQTFMFSKGIATPQEFWAMLYADSDNDPHSAGRQMNNSFITSLIDKDGNWLNHTEQYNITAPMAPLAGQIPHALGIALASKKYREQNIQNSFSNKGNEVSFCVLGDATTSEGVFWESVNAAGVMQVPMAFFILDDGFGISVPSKYQTTKENISAILKGFQTDENGLGFDIYTLKAWDYEGQRNVIDKAISKVRRLHQPAIFHIQECTQPQGHSTSGSHQRYKTAERLNWEKEMDAIAHLEAWILKTGIATKEELQALKMQGKADAKSSREQAWKANLAPVLEAKKAVLEIYDAILETTNSKEASFIKEDLKNDNNITLSSVLKNAHQMQIAILGENHKNAARLDSWIEATEKRLNSRYETHLHSETKKSALKVPSIPAKFNNSSAKLSGHQIINGFFDKKLEEFPNLYAFGEDVGQIGDVNQGFAGLQTKYGESRVFDAGIREWTIIGQGIGMAMRGLRPIAEVQYLDYLVYGLPALTDDLATLRFRTNGRQTAPAIIRTRGHRLEGIWHSGSQIGMLLHSLRGMHVLVPRNMTQAAGMYNTLLASDEPGLVIECLNGYRLKEDVPSNIDEFNVPLGVPEILEEGRDITLVTYGSCVRIAQEAVELLKKKGVSVELIDVQTLLPFDIHHSILESLKKTNRIVFLDEDVPGGATAYMLDEVLNKQDGYHFLDSKPLTISATATRPPYGDDGDYFCKPQVIDVFRAVYNLMKESGF
jgi:pyruvate/2-oxoglutarate/acetoin dehydrogenase E1 component/TPP-dependent pyruvate/acetoin dehydrogenase alpha subunit